MTQSGLVWPLFRRDNKQTHTQNTHTTHRYYLRTTTQLSCTKNIYVVFASWYLQFVYDIAISPLGVCVCVSCVEKRDVC